MENKEIFAIATQAVNSSGFKELPTEDALSILVSIASCAFAEMCLLGDTQLALDTVGLIEDKVKGVRLGLLTPKIPQ